MRQTIENRAPGFLCGVVDGGEGGRVWLRWWREGEMVERERERAPFSPSTNRPLSFSLINSAIF
jgi:hypothetical protein